MTDACLTEQTDEKTQEAHHNENESMACKRLKPSALHRSFQSMYIGAWISLVMAIIVGNNIHNGVVFIFRDCASM